MSWSGTGVSKTRSLSPARKELLGSRPRSPLLPGEGPCPLSPPHGFFNTRTAPTHVSGSWCYVNRIKCGSGVSKTRQFFNTRTAPTHVCVNEVRGSIKMRTGWMLKKHKTSSRSCKKDTIYQFFGSGEPFEPRI
jgi:hypothetical protein